MTCYKVPQEAKEFFSDKYNQDKRIMYPLAICGRSRIGKSTFIRHLCGLLKNEIKTASGDKVVTQGIDLILRKF